MTQQKAASLSSSLFARKGKASPAGLLISELEAAGAESFRSGGQASATNIRASGHNGGRRPKPAAELPLLAFVEAQAQAEEATDGKAATAEPAGEPAPAASLLERGARSLRRANGPGSVAPVAAEAAGNAVAAGGETACDTGADPEGIVATETISGDANVAAIEDAPQDDEGRAEAPAAAAVPVDAPPTDAPPAEANAAAAPAGQPVAAEPEAAQPGAATALPDEAAAERALPAVPAMPASLALRKGAALHTAPAAPPELAPPPPRPRALAWRSAAAVTLGAILGLGLYLVLTGEPAAPPVASAPAAAPATVAVPPATPEPPAVVEAALPEPSFDIIRIEPDGQSIIAGRAAPGSEWILLNNGSPIASVRADANGEWVVLPNTALVPGANAFSLVPKAERGRVAIPAPAALTPEPASPGEPVQTEPPLEAVPSAGPRTDAATPALPRPKPRAAAAAAPAASATFHAAAAGAYEVQLASVRQSADANRESLRLTAAFPELLGAMDLRVQEARLEGAGVFYRVRSGAIGDLGVARNLCRRLEAAGQGCLVVRRPEDPASDVAEDVPDAASAVRQQAERPR